MKQKNLRISDTDENISVVEKKKHTGYFLVQNMDSKN